MPLKSKGRLKFLLRRVSQVFKLPLVAIRKSVRIRNVNRLRERWEARLAEESSSNQTVLEEALKDMTVRVINLERRVDRLASISTQLQNMGIPNFELVIGIDGRREFPQHDPVLSGSIGCEISHIAAISAGVSRATNAIMVCEDDLIFLESQGEVAETIAEFLANPNLDVLCLSGRPRGGSYPISSRLRLVIGVVGRGCYIAKPHAAGALLRAFSEGLSRLDGGSLKGKGDLTWRKLQSESLFFAFPRQDLAKQMEDFSDIENRHLGPR